MLVLIKVNNNNIKNAAGVIKYSCGVMFALFCFCFIYFIQGEILAEAQFVYSGGVTKYHSIMSPLIISGVLLIIQWLFYNILRLPQRFYAVSFFPSAMILAMLTSIDKECIEHFSFGAWAWAFPFAIILYFVVVVLLRKFFQDKYQDKQTYDIIITPNCIVLLVLFIWIGSVANNNDLYLYELKTERLVAEGDYEGAVDVGERSLVSSPELTQLRMYSLAKQGQLAERIFDFPQYYGAQGLLAPYDTLQSRFKKSRIYRDLGAIPHHTVKTTKRYLQLVVNDDSLRTQMSVDYYLCYHLLNKDLKSFVNLLYKNYNPEKEHLPRAYQEALVLVADQKGDSLTCISPEIMEMYNGYKSAKVQFLTENSRKNRTRQWYGNSYWWYYEN